MDNKLRSPAGFEYHTLDLNGHKKSHFLPGIEIYHRGFIYSNTGLRAGLPVNNENSFHKIQTVLYKKGSKDILLKWKIVILGIVKYILIW